MIASAFQEQVLGLVTREAVTRSVSIETVVAELLDTVGLLTMMLASSDPHAPAIVVSLVESAIARHMGHLQQAGGCLRH